MLQYPDQKWLILDSTVILARQHAAGPNTNDNHEDLGQSRHGFGTKIHSPVDSLGHPTRIELSPGQDANINHAESLIEGQKADAMIGDKGHDSDKHVKSVESTGRKPSSVTQESDSSTQIR